MTVWSWLFACSVPSCAGEVAPSAPSAPAAPPVKVGDLLDVTRLDGLCDASAAVEVDGFLVVADDENDELYVFDASFRPVQRLDLKALDPAFAAKKEADLEGMTTAPDGVVWVIGSHDAGKGTEPQKNRFVLAPLRFAKAGDGLMVTLAGAVDTSGAVRALVEAGTDGKTAKDLAGLSIEGLAWRGDGLDVGFRTPIRDQRAAVVHLVAGAAPTVEWLGTQGLGIRALEDDLVLAGGDAGFRLFRRDGAALVDQEVDLGDFTAEGLVKLRGAWWVLADEGRRKDHGEECRTLPGAQRWTRIGRLP